MLGGPGMPSATPKQLYMRTLGCPKNRVDSEVMLGTLAGKGFTLVPNPADADVIVVNTCAFLSSAVEESIDTIVELGEFKKHGRCETLVVTGCLPQRHGVEISSQLPEVDHFLGTGSFASIGDLLATENAPRQVIPDPEYILSAGTPRINSMPAYTAYVKISEGCDNKCAFCIIPKLRGAQRSRPIADIVTEATRLAASGVKELNLVAQDLTAYGHDLPGRPKLHELLRALAKVEVAWIRLHYAYPRDFPDALISAMAEEPRVAKYLDMPVQHASDRLLRRMRRGRDAAFITGLIDKLRAKVPGIVMRTSLIVGLPGETDDDFKLLLQFVARMRFERLGVFRYSDEAGTASFEMEEKVPQNVINRRWRELMALQRRISRETNRSLIGATLPVLVEGVSDESEHLLVGRHQGQAPEIDGQVYINDGSALPGDLVNVQMSAAHDYDLVGAIQSAAAAA